MAKKCLVVPDIHENVDFMNFIDDTIVKQNPEKVVFLGDYFGKKNQTNTDLAYTIKWLNQKMYDPRCHFLFGNHEMLVANGKHRAKEQIDYDLDPNFWVISNFSATYGKWLFSHAGFTVDSIRHIDDIVAAKHNMKNHIWHPLIGFKGPLWIDIKHLNPIMFINQIFGHNGYYQERSTLQSLNYCVDDAAKMVVLVNNINTKVTIIKNNGQEIVVGGKK